MTLIVKKAGILDTFQDCGRFGFMRFGINPNGAMDGSALRMGNILLGNNECEAALEMHFPAPVVEFRRTANFALTGADFEARLNSKMVARNTVHVAKNKDVLEFKKWRSGQRCYLSVRNGFELDEWLDSKSTNIAAGISGFEGRKIKAGDKLKIGTPGVAAHSFTAAADCGFTGDSVLRFVPSSAFRDLTALSKLTLRTGTFVIKRESNRMGYRLDGPPLHLLDENERISSAVTFGTIQLLPDKQLIILMADHQTTGGYPNLGTVTETDLSAAAQLGPGDSITFKAVSVPEAEYLARETERNLAFLKTGLRLRGAWNS